MLAKKIIISMVLISALSFSAPTQASTPLIYTWLGVIFTSEAGSFVSEVGMLASNPQALLTIAPLGFASASMAFAIYFSYNLLRDTNTLQYSQALAVVLLFWDFGALVCNVGSWFLFDAVSTMKIASTVAFSFNALGIVNNLIALPLLPRQRSGQAPSAPQYGGL